MYFVTNRKLSPAKKGLDIFGDTPNPKGSNELRLVKVDGTEKKCTSQTLMDKLPKSEVLALKKKYKLNIDTDEDWYASLRVACELFDQANKQSKPFFAGDNFRLVTKYIASSLIVNFYVV